MQFSILLPASLLLSLAASQSTSTSLAAGTTSICAAQPVLEQCIASTTAIATSCGPTDYNCLCQKYDAVLVCYNNCPNDGRRPAAQSTRDTYCANASIYQSTTTTGSTVGSASATTTTVASGTTILTDTMGASTATTGVVRTSTISSTNSAATGTATGNSAAWKLGPGGALMGVVGVMGALL